MQEQYQQNACPDQGKYHFVSFQLLHLAMHVLPGAGVDTLLTLEAVTGHCRRLGIRQFNI